MALHRRQRHEFDLAFAVIEPFVEFLLLAQRKQKVRFDTDDQHPARAGAFQGERKRAAMIGEIENVHRTGKIEIAVGIERADKFVRVRLEIRFDFEVDAERIPVLPLLGDAFVAESLFEFFCATVGHHAQLAGKPHAHYRLFRGIVIAAHPGRVAPNDFPLQRTQTDREGRRSRSRRNDDHAIGCVRIHHGVGERCHTTH